jgi:hypothetical protein
MAKETKLKTLVVPKGFEKYQTEDFSLLEGEEVKKILQPKHTAYLRSYLLGALLIILGLSFYSLSTLATLRPIHPTDLILPGIIFAITYFVYYVGPTKTAKKIALETIKYILLVITASYFLAYLLNLFKGPVADFLSAFGVSLPEFDLTPLGIFGGMLTWFVDTLNSLLARFQPLFTIGSFAIIALGIAIPLLTFLFVRGRLYYITNRRIIVRKKFFTHHVATLPIDQITEVIAFKGFLGRIFGFGDITITLTSGAGLEKTMAPRRMGITKPFYKIERALAGIDKPFEIRDLILQLREAYIEALYLRRMEKELVRIREGIEKLVGKEVAEKIVPIPWRKREDIV